MIRTITCAWRKDACNRSWMIIAERATEFGTLVDRMTQLWLRRSLLTHTCRRQVMKFKYACTRRKANARRFESKQIVIKAAEAPSTAKQGAAAGAHKLGAKKSLWGRRLGADGVLRKPGGFAGRGASGGAMSNWLGGAGKALDDEASDGAVSEQATTEVDRLKYFDASTFSAIVSPRYKDTATVKLLRPALFGNAKGMPKSKRRIEVQPTTLHLTPSSIFNRDFSLKSVYYGGDGLRNDTTHKKNAFLAGKHYSIGIREDWDTIFECFYPALPGQGRLKMNQKPKTLRTEDLDNHNEKWSQTFRMLLKAMGLSKFGDTSSNHRASKEFASFRVDAARRTLSRLTRRDPSYFGPKWSKDSFRDAMTGLQNLETTAMQEQTQLSPFWVKRGHHREMGIYTKNQLLTILEDNLGYYGACTDAFYADFHEPDDTRGPNAVDSELAELKSMGLEDEESAQPRYCTLDFFLQRFQALRANHGFSNTEVDGVANWFLNHPFSFSSVKQLLLRWGIPCDFKTVYRAVREVVPGVTRYNDYTEKWKLPEHEGQVLCRVCLPQILYVLQAAMLVFEKKLREHWAAEVDADITKSVSDISWKPSYSADGTPKLHYPLDSHKTSHFISQLTHFHAYSALGVNAPALHEYSKFKAFVRQVIQNRGFSTEFIMVVKNSFLRLSRNKPDNPLEQNDPWYQYANKRVLDPIRHDWSDRWSTLHGLRTVFGVTEKTCCLDIPRDQSLLERYYGYGVDGGAGSNPGTGGQTPNGGSLNGGSVSVHDAKGHAGGSGSPTFGRTNSGNEEQTKANDEEEDSYLSMALAQHKANKERRAAKARAGSAEIANNIRRGSAPASPSAAYAPVAEESTTGNAATGDHVELESPEHETTLEAIKEGAHEDATPSSANENEEDNATASKTVSVGGRGASKTSTSRNVSAATRSERKAEMFLSQSGGSMEDLMQVMSSVTMNGGAGMSSQAVNTSFLRAIRLKLAEEYLPCATDDLRDKVEALKKAEKQFAEQQAVAQTAEGLIADASESPNAATGTGRKNGGSVSLGFLGRGEISGEQASVTPVLAATPVSTSNLGDGATSSGTAGAAEEQTRPGSALSGNNRTMMYGSVPSGVPEVYVRGGEPPPLHIRPRQFYLLLQQIGFNGPTVQDLAFLHQLDAENVVVDLYQCLVWLQLLLNKERQFISQLFVMYAFMDPKPRPKNPTTGPRRFKENAPTVAPHGYLLCRLDTCGEFVKAREDSHSMDVMHGVRDDPTTRIDMDVLNQLMLSLGLFPRKVCEGLEGQHSLELLNASLESVIEAKHKAEGGAGNAPAEDVLEYDVNKYHVFSFRQCLKLLNKFRVAAAIERERDILQGRRQKAMSRLRGAKVLASLMGGGAAQEGGGGNKPSGGGPGGLLGVLKAAASSNKDTTSSSNKNVVVVGSSKSLLGVFKAAHKATRDEKKEQDREASVEGGSPAAENE
ncbi:unnamed protein product [Amoebophrya sp. A25]|nr:unnamed protein product [Amoebophrya sp. A25]|eukprot:GSA25T00003446001.1